MRLMIDRNWRVNASTSLRLDLSQQVLWGQMRDWRRFLLIDPLHERLSAIQPNPKSDTPQGTRFLIHHRFLGVGPTRRGRILSWREGSGLAISDLSRHGVGRSFPHICAYRVEPAEHGSCLVLGVRGVWTARWIPRPFVKLWLGWVLLSTELRVRRELTALARWRKRLASDATSSQENTRASSPARV